MRADIDLSPVDERSEEESSIASDLDVFISYSTQTKRQKLLSERVDGSAKSIDDFSKRADRVVAIGRRECRIVILHDCRKEFLESLSKVRPEDSRKGSDEISSAADQMRFDLGKLAER